MVSITQSYSRKILVLLIIVCLFAFVLPSALEEQTSSSKLRQTKKKKAEKCKRQKKLKSTKTCKSENVYSGLQDIDLVPPTANSEIAIYRCVGAFQSSGFNLFDFDNYSNWINENSLMMVADTGVFVGLDGIKEYVQIALQPHPTDGVIKDIVALDPQASQFLPITADGNECVFMNIAKAKFITHQLSVAVHSVIGQRFSFTILDDGPPAKILVNRMDIYTPQGMLGYLFAPTQGIQFATHVCETMQTSCTSTFKNNCYTTTPSKDIESCIAELLSLAPHDDVGRLDGKSFGCRVLHAGLAKSNDKHCPHISFDPEYDYKCHVKCQKSKEINNEDMFHPIELGFLATFAADVGLGQEQWKTVE